MGYEVKSGADIDAMNKALQHSAGYLTDSIPLNLSRNDADEGSRVSS